MIIKCKECGTSIEIEESQYSDGATSTTLCPLCGNEISFSVAKMKTAKDDAPTISKEIENRLQNCPQCGIVLPVDAAFCLKCGCRINPQLSYPFVVAQPKENTVVSIPTKKNSQSIFSKKGNNIAIVLVVLAIIVVFCVVYYSVNKQGADHFPTKEQKNVAQIKGHHVKEKNTNIRHAAINRSFHFNGVITYKDYRYDFKMDLECSDNIVSGKYIVTNGENVYVQLKGTLNDNGKLELTEYKNDITTGYSFKGYLENYNIYTGEYNCYTGEYINTQNGLTMKFNAKKPPMDNIDGTYSLNGTIGQYKIHMDITINDSEVWGTYSYESQPKDKKMTLRGTIDENHYIYMLEYDPEGYETGCFGGNFDGNIYEGGFSNYSHGSNLDFRLKRL